VWSCAIRIQVRRTAPIKDQRGIILIAVLLILFLLVAIGLGSVVSIQNDHRVTSNLRSASSALYLADSGIEWVKERLADAPNFSPELPDRTLSLQTGTFSVALISSTQPSALKGQVVVRSTGIVSNATQIVQARMTKEYDLADAALVLRGDARGLTVRDASFVSDGRDHDPTTLAVIAGSRPRLAASAGNAALLGLLISGSGADRANSFIGGNAGREAIARTDWLPRDFVSEFADRLCTSGSTAIASVPASGKLSLNNISWGNRMYPEIRCIDGTSDSTDLVELTGEVRGAGLLVVRNSELLISGTFKWEGLIIVAGRDVGVQIAGSAQKEIIGALAVVETGAALGTGPALFDAQGSLRILYSRQTLELAARLIPSAMLRESFSKLPFNLRQDYWRTITP